MIDEEVAGHSGRQRSWSKNTQDKAEYRSEGETSLPRFLPRRFPKKTDMVRDEACGQCWW